MDESENGTNEEGEPEAEDEESEINEPEEIVEEKERSSREGDEEYASYAPDEISLIYYCTTQPIYSIHIPVTGFQHLSISPMFGMGL